MFQPIPKFCVLFWNIFSVISVNLNYNSWQVVYSLLLVASCVYNLYTTPQVVCESEGNCNRSLTTLIKGLVMQVVAGSCLISRIAGFLKGRNQLDQYKKNIDTFHTLTPMTHSETKNLKKISYQVVILCITLTVPVNLIRIWILLNSEKHTALFIGLSYIQNISMYCIETVFTILCFILYQKFIGINNDLTALKIDTIIRNKYPFMSKKGEKYGKSNNTFDCNEEVLRSLTAGSPMTNYIEKLTTRHRLAREAMKNLNSLFGIHLGLSLCSLCLYTMFDLYYHLLGGIMNPSKSNVLIFGWILQYTIRFLIIAILAQMTTKQVITTILLYDREKK